MPFSFEGVKDDTCVYDMMKDVTTAGHLADQSGLLFQREDEYFPPPDSAGGWRTMTDSYQMKQVTGIDKTKLDKAIDFIRTTTDNLVLSPG